MYEVDVPPESTENSEWTYLELFRISEKLQDVEGLVMEQDLPTHGLGWKDLIGDVNPKSTGGGRPTLDLFRGRVRWFSYGAGDDGDMAFHIPHDYALGTDIFLHIHWSHNGTNISGEMDIRADATYAKSHGRAVYPAPIETNVIASGLDISNTPRYHTRIEEIQLSTPGGSASMLDTDDIDVDGLIMIHYDMLTVPAISGGVVRPFIMAADLHYQTNLRATISKVPDFNIEVES